MINRIASHSFTTHLPLAGHVLVSTERCDQSLRGSVCLVLHHGAKGSMGMVLNRAMDNDVEELWKHLNPPLNQPVRPIQFGGPISGPIIALHSHEHLAEAWAGTGVYVAAHLDKLQQLVALDAGQIRIVVGQLHWNAGELEKELVSGQWLALPATPELVFAPNEEMWRRGMREAGNRLVALLSGADVASHASLN
jgi:putative transcriptional regulator